MKGSTTRVSEWKSAAAEERFRAREDSLVRQRSNDLPTAVDVTTALGPTRAYRWDGHGDPVVFLHGATGTGLTWLPYTDRRNGRLAFAIDTIGDVGRSRQEGAIECQGDLAEWLAEVLNATGVERAHLVGTSYGAFLALNLAVHKPERVRSLFLIEPAGLVRARRTRFITWGLSSFVAAWFPQPVRRFAARRLRNPIVDDRETVRLGVHAARNFRGRLWRPIPFTDGELASIEAPTRAFVAERSEAFSPRLVSERLRLVTGATIEVVRGAGHALSLSNVDELATDLAGWLNAFETT